MNVPGSTGGFVRSTNLNRSQQKRYHWGSKLLPKLKKGKGKKSPDFGFAILDFGLTGRVWEVSSQTKQPGHFVTLP
jgi:hypothetical protein